LHVDVSATDYSSHAIYIILDESMSTSVGNTLCPLIDHTLHMWLRSALGVRDLEGLYRYMHRRDPEGFIGYTLAIHVQDTHVQTLSRIKSVGVLAVAILYIFSPRNRDDLLLKMSNLIHNI
ncbi:hypothetical protein ACJX0J_015815, partial [Zea mays]